MPEHVTTNAEVAAAVFAPNPAMYNKGTTKLPPPLPINPAKKPRTEPPEIPKIVRSLDESSPLFGFQPLSINIAAAAVNNAKIRITGFVGRLIFSYAPNRANNTIASPKGIATFQSINFFFPYVTAADELLTTFSSIPNGIACVLKSIPNQNKIGIYN